MSAPVYFISDLHLDDSRPRVTEAFEDFLAQRRHAAALYILGDLFETWVGDDEDSPLIRRVARALRHFSDSGARLYLMHGNRDFLIGERFAARTGATLLEDPTVVEEQGQKLLLMHGDSLCTHDTEYQAFRAHARSAQWQQEILALPLAARREMAAKLRAMSRDAGSRKADDIMDVTEKAVVEALSRTDATALIHGHTHRPARHEDRAGVRWVLGDWEASGWYLTLEDQEFNLKEFNIN